jgi:hypothetical protein
MATVTGLTAERMITMENATVIDGDIVGDDLVLKTRDGTEINAGNVRGPTGSPGVSQAELDAFMSDSLPICSIIDYMGTAAPNPKWILMFGQTIANGDTLYPAFWAKIPAAMKSGSSIVMPDTRKKVSVCYDVSDADFGTLNKTGGSKTAQLPTHAHAGPSHSHGIVVDPNNGSTGLQNANHAHSFSGNTDAGGDHRHPPAGATAFVGAVGGSYWFSLGAGYNDFNTVGGTTDWAGNHAHSYSGGTGLNNANHSHSLSHAHTASSAASGTANTGPAGVAPTSDGNLPPYIVFLRMVKVL